MKKEITTTARTITQRTSKMHPTARSTPLGPLHCRRASIVGDLDTVEDEPLDCKRALILTRSSEMSL
jgi:hypothetical protein